MTPDHGCAHPGCSAVVPGYLLACRLHWAQLPPDLRRDILRAWQRRRRNPADDTAVGLHLDAVVRAIECWSAA